MINSVGYSEQDWRQEPRLFALSECGPASHAKISYVYVNKFQYM